jgi:electron transfer flavoprotein beta subunit
MPLKIIVCIKQVPHPEHFSKISLDPVRQTITREGIPAIINSLDKNAIEEGLRLREKFSGKVTVISMGPPQAKDALEEALAMGVDNAILLCDRAFAGADTLATAYSLAYCIKKSGQFDLVLCGNSTVDSGTGQVGPQLAELLNIAHASFVKQVVFEQKRSLIVTRALERGYMKLRVKLPALLSVVKEINQPRLPTIWGILEAKNKEITVWGAADVGAIAENIGLSGSPTQVIGVCKSEIRRENEIFEGPPEEIVKKALARLSKLQAI